MYLSQYAKFSSKTKKYTEFEVFTALTMRSVVFWDVAPCESCKNRNFVETYRLLLQVRKIC
jgi:hypothetical protein